MISVHVSAPAGPKPAAISISHVGPKSAKLGSFGAPSSPGALLLNQNPNVGTIVVPGSYCCSFVNVQHFNTVQPPTFDRSSIFLCIFLGFASKDKSSDRDGKKEGGQGASHPLCHMPCTASPLIKTSPGGLRTARATTTAPLTAVSHRSSHTQLELRRVRALSPLVSSRHSRALWVQ